MNFRQFLEYGTQKRHTTLPGGNASSGGKGGTAGRAGESPTKVGLPQTRAVHWKPNIPETNKIKNPVKPAVIPMKPLKAFIPRPPKIDNVVA